MLSASTPMAQYQLIISCRAVIMKLRGITRPPCASFWVEISACDEVWSASQRECQGVSCAPSGPEIPSFCCPH